jgi:hypothetical protein
MAVAVSTLAALAARQRPAESEPAIILATEPPTETPTDLATESIVEHDGASASTSVSRWRHLDVRSAAIATSIAVIVVVAIALVIDLSPVPAWIVIGVVLAMSLDPLVGWLVDHTPLGRGAAIGAVVVGLFATVVAMLVFAVPSIVGSVGDLDDELPRIAADLEQLPLIGDELAERGVADRLQTTLEEAPDRLASDTGPLERALRSVGDVLIATFWVLLRQAEIVARPRVQLDDMLPSAG